MDEIDSGLVELQGLLLAVHKVVYLHSQFNGFFNLILKISQTGQ
jgi:hypothetical protein